MLWCYILLLFYLPFTISHSTLYKRQAVASKACGDRDQTVGICSPSSTDTWYNNTYHELTWNYNNPVFNGFETLTFYLLQQNGSSDYQKIKSFDVVHAVGVQVVLVDDSWYPSALPVNSPNVTRTVFTYLIGSSVDLQQELDNPLSLYPRPSQFTMIQNSHNTTTTGTNGAPASTLTTAQATNQSNQESSPSLPAWAIAIIVIAAVAVIIAAVALAWLIRNMRRNRQRDHQLLNKTDMDHDDVLDSNNNNDEMTQVGNTAAILGSTPNASKNRTNDSNDNINNRNVTHHHQIDTHDLSSSIHSSTPMIHGSVRGSPTAPSPTSIERSPSITTNTTSATTAGASSSMNPAALHLMQPTDATSQQTSSILSSTDALMIADTFRHLLRKPNWSDTAGASATLDDNNDDDETEEQKRKRVSNILLQEQLAKEEGATVKDIERR